MRHIGNIVNLALILACVLISTNAWAEDCSNLDMKWKGQLKTFEELLNHGEYKKAGDLYKTMAKQCSKSPELNYYEGRRRDAMQDTEGAKVFYQRATEYTYTIAVEPEMAQRIWYTRYEAESPERSKDRYLELKKKIDTTDNALQETETKIQALLAERADGYKKEYSIGMWTGIGVGVAGIVLLSTGTGIAASMKDNETYHAMGNSVVDSGASGASDPQPVKYKVDGRFRAGLAVAGVGAAATLIGAVVSGIYGYKLMHAGDDDTLSVQVAPNSISLSMTF